jgi:hypothetical protein
MVNGQEVVRMAYRQAPLQQQLVAHAAGLLSAEVGEDKGAVLLVHVHHGDGDLSVPNAQKPVLTIRGREQMQVLQQIRVRGHGDPSIVSENDRTKYGQRTYALRAGRIGGQ